MRVLVHEHLCSLAAITSSLRAEGQAMLCAVLADLAACPGVEPVTLAEPALVEPLRRLAPTAEIHPVAADDVEKLFRRLAREAEFTLVIAPEFDDLLATRCEWALEEGSRLLGPTPEAVRLCADKLHLARHLRGHGVPTPPTRLFDPNRVPPTFPVVCKLRHGAGTQAVFVVDREADLHDAVARVRQEGFHDDLIVQPYLAGLHASVSLFVGPRQRLGLPPAEQFILQDSPQPPTRLHYRGGQLPIRDRDCRLRAGPLAERVIDVVPGLGGLFGVDIVLGDDPATDVIIEINPRLTTSYVGLRRLTNVNLMQVLLDLVRERPVEMPRWHPGPVRFDPDGTIH
jgi:predicted ATP-grasp superfamily ATP-dependent carboligase